MTTSDRIAHGNELQAAAKRLIERIIEAERDGYELSGDLIVEKMQNISEQRTAQNVHAFEPLRRLFEAAIDDIDQRFPRGKK